MDNITHSLAGLAVGELIHRTLPAEPSPAAQSTRRRMMLAACMAANNFPDLDLLLSGRLPAPLGYLLHHRGHTHTLLYALPQAVLVAALVWLLWPAARRLLGTSSAARVGLAVAAALGPFMHIGFDFLNSYGVHPLHPFDPRWLYGDTLFIVEPLLWVAFGAPLAMMLPRRSWRLLPMLLAAAVFALAMARGFLGWGSVLALATAGLGLAWLQHRCGQARHAIVAGLALALGFAAVQALVSAQGKVAIAQDLLRADPALRVLDVAMTPLPANPLCWSFVSLTRSPSSPLYELRRGMYSAAPRRMGVAACPAGLSMQGLSGSAQIGYGWRQAFAVERLRELAATCRGDAWLRFARMPALWPNEATDARFSATAGANFSTMALEALDALPCPDGVPRWGMPRADLVSSR